MYWIIEQIFFDQTYWFVSIITFVFVDDQFISLPNYFSPV